MHRLLSFTATLLVLSFQAAHTSEASSYAALGDSYASGDGAGSSRLLPNFDITCGRFDQAYPVLVANSSELDIPEDDFRNLACGGASSVSMLYSQVPKIGRSDVVTITVGGNEVDFFVVLNACIHQWLPSRSCDIEMAKARALVQSASFLTNFNKMVVGTIRWAPDALLLVTGYATFFNDQTEQCSNVSFSRKDPSNVLSNELRSSFNQMVRMINDVIQAAAEAHGAIYVDVDSLYHGHRFCEEGVIEPSSRNETWFFNVNLTRSDAKLPDESGQESQQRLPGPIKDFFDLTRTFHPTALGHAAIAKEIVRVVQAEQLLGRNAGSGPKP